jgi:hypothetical protein
MELIPVKVEFHAGYKADEYPRCFYLDKYRIDIVEVIDRWYQGNSNPDFPEANYFKVVTPDRKQFILKYVQESDNWVLVVYA